jgi:hypothetical protein
MLVGVKMIGVYQNRMTLYLACIESDGDKADRSQHQKMFTKRYNAAVDEQTNTVEKFNAEIRRFKRRSK